MHVPNKHRLFGISDLFETIKGLQVSDGEVGHIFARGQDTRLDAQVRRAGTRLMGKCRLLDGHAYVRLNGEF